MTGKESAQPLVVGWREWLSLPELGIPAIKAKIDTGARTSALHAFSLQPYEENGKARLRFGIHPLQKDTSKEIYCTADIVDQRVVSDSGGHREERYVIKTLVRLEERVWPIEMTLTNREDMLFRMLLGRTAMKGRILVDPARSFVTGRHLQDTYSNSPKER